MLPVEIKDKAGELIRINDWSLEQFTQVSWEAIDSFNV
jgi:hypothetical protein